MMGFTLIFLLMWFFKNTITKSMELIMIIRTREQCPAFFLYIEKIGGLDFSDLVGGSDAGFAGGVSGSS